MTRKNSSQAPHDLLAEQAVLGALLIDPAAIHRLDGALVPNDFYTHGHRTVYAAALTLRNRGTPLDIITLGEHMEAEGTLDDIGGLQYLGTIAKDTPSAANVRAYAAIVSRHAEARRLMGVLQEGLDRLQRGEEAGVVASGIAQATANHRMPTVDIFTAMDLHRKQFAPVKWAIPGFLPEGLCLLAGKPKMGKSWMALALGIAVATGGAAFGKIRTTPGSVLYLALEDSPRRLKSRISILLDQDGDAAYPDRLHLAKRGRGTARTIPMAGPPRRLPSSRYRHSRKDPTGSR